MKKNCLTCKWEPDWTEAFPGAGYNSGRCKFPVPFWTVLPAANLLESDLIEKYDTCPAHQPKDAEGAE